VQKHQELIKKEITMRKKGSIMLSLAIIFSVLLTSISYADVTTSYQNPLMRGADPTIARAADGFYYSCFAINNDIYLKKADTILGVSTAKSRLVWDKPADFGYVWGPYIYRLDGKWYIYFTSGPEIDFGYGHPSSYVLENTSPDPFEGTWQLKGMSSNADADGKVTEKAGLLNTEGYGLVCGVVTMGGKTYLTYTKYFYYPDPMDSTKEKFDECPTIVEMKDPWTLQGKEGTLARPLYEWEKNGDSINEGAAVVERNGKIYFGYSVSSFMNDNYGVGISTATSGAILLEESSWTKNPEPAMLKSPENSSFGPGSPLFLKSEDGTEGWLIYHGGPVGGQTGSNRWVRSQRINWNDDGSINLGIPSNPGTVLDRPSGEELSETYEAEDAAFGGVTRTILSDSSKSSGSGVMKYNSSNGYVEFTVDANMSGSYSLNFRYNNSTASNIPMSLQVNQNGTSELSFSPNGINITNYDLLRADNVQLNAGHNKIRLYSNVANGLVLDAMIIKRSVKYEAESPDSVTLSGGAKVATDHSGYSGNGFVSGLWSEGSSTKFTVNAPYAGNYSVNLRYCNGFDVDKKLSLYVNDVKVKQIDLFGYSDWEEWAERYDNIELKTGSNTIEYKYDNGDSGDVNLDYISVTEATTKHYEAENAILTGNATKATDHSGYTGTGFVGGFWKEGSVDFSVNVENAAQYDVKLKYALGFAEGRTISLYLNGAKVKQISLPSSGGWDTWSEHLETLSLNKGNNTISFKRDSGDSGDINIDNIHLNKRVTWKYQAEEATMVGGAHKSDDHLWYEGTGFVGGFESAYTSETQYEGIKFKVNVPNTASYTTTLRYCAGSGPRTISLYVNGSKIKQLLLPGTANWDSWGESTEMLNLKAGNNVVEYRRDALDNGGFNIDSITIDKDSGGSTDLKSRGIVSGTVYSIRAKHSGKSLDVAGYSSDAGALVNQWTYLANNNQKWEIIDLGNGYYEIKSAHSGKVLDVVNNDNKDICQMTASGIDSQQWKIEKVGGYYKIINKQYGKGLDVSGESKNNGAGVHLWDYLGISNQLWKIEIPSSYEMFIPVTGITDVTATASAGTDLMLHGYTLPFNASNQTMEWSVKDAKNTGAAIKNNVLTTTEAGIAVVTATILDGTAEGSSYTQDFTITVNPNSVPTAKTKIPTQTIPMGNSAGFTASDIAVDVDGNALTITEVKAQSDSAKATAVLNNGTVTISGVAEGSTDITVTVSDGIGGTVDIVVPIEVTAIPNVEIAITQSPVKTILNAITFGLFFNDSIDVSLTSGYDTVEYQLVDSTSTYNPEDAWTTGKTFSISPEFKGRVYARIVFTNGTVSEAFVKALIVDKTIPEINAVYDAESASIAVAVTDVGAGIKTITYQVGSGELQTVNLEPTENIDITTEYNINISSLTNGVYDVVINAFDNSDNKAITKTVNVDRTTPSIPTNLTTTPAAIGAGIELGWSEVSGATGYNVYMSTTENGIYTKLTNSVVITNSYSSTGLSAATTYYYQVTAVNSEGESDRSAVAFATTTVVPGTPATPANLKATAAGISSINIDWTAVTDATNYNVYRAITADGTYSKLAEITTESAIYVDTELQANTTYYYKVTAVNSEGESDRSAVAFATTTSDVGVPATPANLTATATGISSINIDWTAVTDATSYNVYRAMTADGTYSKRAEKTTESAIYVDTELQANTTYYYKVTAVNSAGESAKSAVASATTAKVISETPTPPVVPVVPVIPAVPAPTTSYSGTSVTSTTTADAKSDVDGNATAIVKESQITEALTKAIAEAAKNVAGTKAIVEIKVSAAADAKSVETSIPAASITALSDSKINAMIITSPIATISFDAKALSKISNETDADVKITASKVNVSMLSEVKQSIGDRPVFNFSVTSDGKTVSEFGGNATVTVPYTLKSGEDKNAIVIYYINAAGKAEIVKNCKYDIATGSIIFKTTHFSQYAVGYNKVEFSDVGATAWYSDAVGYVAARDITAGTGENKFSPAEKLTRGQFLVMVMKAYGQKPDENAEDNFTDAGNTYYTGYLAAAKRLGITSGIGENKYAPQNQITRQEMFTLLYNTLKLIGQLPTNNNGNAVTTFADAGDIAPWAKDAMTMFVNAGIIAGSDNKLTPVATTNRAQMAQVLYNLLSK